MHIHDLTSDPLAWSKQADALHVDNNDLYELITQRGSTGKYLVIIDSLSQLILQRSAAYTCNVLHRLATDKGYSHLLQITVSFLQCDVAFTCINDACVEGGRKSQVMAVCHRDVHDDSVLSHLRHVAQTVITLRSSPVADADAACTITHRRHRGKVLYMVRLLQITNIYCIIMYVVLLL